MALNASQTGPASRYRIRTMLRMNAFRKYDEPSQSYKDHSDFLKGSSRYASLFNLDPLDYEGWAYGLKKAGYATNPRYPQVIIKLVETYQLQDYTLIALGKMPPKEEMLAKTGIENTMEWSFGFRQQCNPT